MIDDCHSGSAPTFCNKKRGAFTELAFFRQFNVLTPKSHHYPVVCGRLEVLDIHNTDVSRGSLLNELNLDGSLFSVTRKNTLRKDTPFSRSKGIRLVRTLYRSTELLGPHFVPLVLEAVVHSCTFTGCVHGRGGLAKLMSISLSWNSVVFQQPGQRVYTFSRKRRKIEARLGARFWRIDCIEIILCDNQRNTPFKFKNSAQLWGCCYEVPPPDGRGARIPHG